MGSQPTGSNNRSNEAILRIDGVSKHFGKTVALNCLSLSVFAGEIIALLGESGSGKTTLLRIIAGFELPTAGRLSLSGQEISSSSNMLAPEKREIGMVFQDYALFPHLTVSQNILYGLSSWKMADKQQQLQKMLRLVGLGGLEERYPHELSGGQQQRVALARAIATEPKLLLLDEPFSNLDEGLKAQVRKDLKALLKSLGITAVFVTHDTKDALATADRIVMLRGGELQQVGTPFELYNAATTEYVASYFGAVNWLDNSLLAGEEGVKIGVRPIHLAPKEDFGAGQAVLSFWGTVSAIAFMGEYWEVFLRSDEGQPLLAWLSYEPSLSIGDRLEWACLHSMVMKI